MTSLKEAILSNSEGNPSYLRHSLSDSIDKHELDDGGSVEYPNKDEVITLRRVPDAVPWSAYCGCFDQLLATSFILRHCSNSDS